MKYLVAILTLVILNACQTSVNQSKFAKIEYEAGACFGFCPIYKMTINADRTAIFEAQRFNFSQDRESQENEGNFKGTITEKDYAHLVALIDSANPKLLKNYYGNKNVSDLPTSYLTITYQNGNVKRIQDYGKHGTPELEKIYEMFEELKTTQSWTKTE